MRYSTSFIVWFFIIKNAINDTKLILEVNSLGSQRIKSLTLFDKKFLNVATSVITISSILGNYIKDNFGIVANVVPNGISSYRVPEKLINIIPKNRDTFKIVYAGLLKP